MVRCGGGCPRAVCTMVRTSGGGKPPPYAVGTDRPVRWFSACTGGGTHRSRPTNHMGSPFVFVGRHLCVPPCGGGVDNRCIPANPYRTVRKFDGAVCGPTPQGGFSWPVGPIHLLWASAPTGCHAINQPNSAFSVHTGGGTHRSRPTRTYGTRFWRGWGAFGPPTATMRSMD